MNVHQLTKRIDDLIATARQAHPRAVRKPVSSPHTSASPTVFVVDDDEVLLASLRDMLQHRGHTVETFPSAATFLAAFQGARKGCLVVDSVMPGMSGLELLDRLKLEGRDLPSIVITGYGDIPMAIKAMKVGAMDFIEKPAQQERLTASIERALAQAGDSAKRSFSQKTATTLINTLTTREREVMNLVVEGLPNKQIAFNLKISQRTVETHRAAVMSRTGAESLPDLIRLVMRAG